MNDVVDLGKQREHKNDQQRAEQYRQELIVALQPALEVMNRARAVDNMHMCFHLDVDGVGRFQLQTINVEKITKLI